MRAKETSGDALVSIRERERGGERKEYENFLRYSHEKNRKLLSNVFHVSLMIYVGFWGFFLPGTCIVFLRFIVDIENGLCPFVNLNICARLQLR